VRRKRTAAQPPAPSIRALSWVFVRTKRCKVESRGSIRAARPGGSLPPKSDRSGVPGHAPLAPRVVTEPMMATAEQCPQATDEAQRRVCFARSARTRPGAARGAGCGRRVALHPLSVPNDRCRCKSRLHVQLYEPRERDSPLSPFPDSAIRNGSAPTSQNLGRLAAIRTSRQRCGSIRPASPCKCTCRCN
jgi:hypothetical protein